MRSIVRCVIAAAVLLAPSVAKAEVITGSFSLGSTEPVTVSATDIEWGGVLFQDGTGDFAALNGTAGTLADLNVFTEPVGAPVSLSNFLTSAFQPGWDFTLTFISPGFGDPAECTDDPADVCTPDLPDPALSPFTIINDADGGSGVQLRMSGILSDGTPGDETMWNAIFTTQFEDMTAADILGVLAAQGEITSSHSSTWNVTFQQIPEPASMLLLGLGFAAVGAMSRRRKA